MSMRDIEYFENALKEERIPTLDKKKLYSAIEDKKVVEVKNKLGFRKAIVVGITIVVLATGFVFGDSIFHQIINKEGEAIFTLRKETNSEYREEQERYENSTDVMEFKQKIREELEPGEIVAYVDMERPSKYKVAFISTPMKFDSIAKMKEATTTPFKTLNGELSGYEFVEGDIAYDFGGYDEMRRIENILIDRAKENNERFEYELVETTKEASNINLTYKNSNDYVIYVNISTNVRMVTKPRLDDSLVKTIKVGDSEVIYDVTSGPEFYYMKDDILYTISSSTFSGFTEESIVNLIQSLE